jgi:hypothetical protein
MDSYQQYIAKSRYARYLPELQRRETWEETVDRYLDFMYYQAKNNTDISKKDLKELYTLLGVTCEE